jgi:hypothetical protein
MTPELFARVDALGPAFRIPLRALTQIDEEFGRACMIEHALRVEDEPTHWMALLIEDYTLGINLMAERSRARTSKQIAKIKKRITKVLQRAKAWADSAPRTTH